jgi:hypothetical protein
MDTLAYALNLFRSVRCAFQASVVPYKLACKTHHNISVAGNPFLVQVQGFRLKKIPF